MYSVVNDGLGRQVAETGAWTFMQEFAFTTADNVKNHLLPNHVLTDNQKSALYNDPEYGLKYLSSYFRWDPLVNGKDPLAYQLLVNELRTHFNLTQSAIEEAKTNWNYYFSKGI